MFVDLSTVPGYEKNRQLAYALILLSCVILGGTIGFVLIEGWDFWRALFFTLITITTVGYGDEGISDDGKKFATLLLVGGIGIASYTFALIVQTAVTHQFAWRKRMQKRINRLSGHTILCGFGRMGRIVAKHLSTAGTPFVIVERDPESYQLACEMGYMSVHGSAGDDETLIRAGIEWASHVISVVSSEAESVVITLSARELRDDVTIVTRAEREEGVRKLYLAGANRIVSPYQSGGADIANQVTAPGVADFLTRTSRAGSDVALADVQIDDGSILVGKTLASYGRREGTKISFVSLEREGCQSLFPPSGNERLAAGDHLIVAGDPDQIARMRERACPRQAA